MRRRKATPLWKYIVLAVLLHFSILLLPGRIVETLFPSTAPESAGPPSDLTPDFEQFAIHVIYIDDEQPQVQITTNRAVEVAPLEARPEYVERLRGSAGPEPTGEGDKTDETPGTGGDDGVLAAEEDRFYPPVPRLIVPPSVEGLDLGDLTITLQILVDKEGRPLEVVINNPPENRVVYNRILEAARQFRFRPARRGTRTVEAWIELPLNLETTRRD